jgi:hypothetical protein
MAEFFKGAKSFFGISSKEEKQLEQMLENYGKGGTPGHKNVVEGIGIILERSPDLRARTLEVIRDRHLTNYSDKAVIGAGSASYQVSDTSIKVAPQLGRNNREYFEMMFILGHETEHARSLKGRNYGTDVLAPAIHHLAESPSVGPRDYTGIINDFAERTRAEEGRAHIGGFNAIASHIISENHPKPKDLLRDLYEAHPGRMGDFINKTSDSVPATYALKDGLTLSRDGMMPYSPENIEAMKGYYADKAQLGAPHMNYRQDSIQFASGIVKNTETGFANRDMEDRSYVIDPTRLNAHPALGLPVDGQLQANGAIKIETLDLSDLGPLIMSPSLTAAASSSSPVRLEPQPGDPPLFAQALPLVVELSGKDKLGEPQELRNIAAALAVAAHDKGLDRIDSVLLSAETGSLIASKGSGPTGQNAAMDGLTAMQTPESTSLAKLPGPSEPSIQPLAQSPQVLVADASDHQPRKQAM